MKRKRKVRRNLPASKRLCYGGDEPPKPSWALLRHYYPVVSTLRQYLVSRLSSASKKRRTHVLEYGLSQCGTGDQDVDAAVVALLDQVVIGSFERAAVTNLESTTSDITVFTQELTNSTSSITPTQGAFKQSEIVDFSLWLLFRRHSHLQRPAHLLAHGYQRTVYTSEAGPDVFAVPGAPGVFSSGGNHYIEVLKQHPWKALPSLVGKGAEQVLSDLLLQCGIYRNVQNSSNLEQISGAPLSGLKVLSSGKAEGDLSETSKQILLPRSNANSTPRTIGLSDVRFVRHRMLYSRPTLSAKGKVKYGLGHSHVFNRFRDVESWAETVHVMRYIFPRQFGLHNVFTFEVDPKDTAQPFKEYTIREPEIAREKLRWRKAKGSNHEIIETSEPPLPKRLRGKAQVLVAGMRKRHAKCPYQTLLNHYCPLLATPDKDLPGTIAQASTLARVSAFCRAAVSRVFPDTLWGAGSTRVHNKNAIFDSIDAFIRLRRYETMSLHDILQKIKTSGAEWLHLSTHAPDLKLCRTDATKRKELMAELLYYVFDSYLIPLIRCHFHVTESGVHRNQLFYFRHDVWKAISEPALHSLKTTMLEQCKTADVTKALTTRALGVSQVRLLPKEHGMRPIINLRRRVQKLQRGQMILGRSINSILTPAFSVLNHEKARKPEMLASALFSVDEIYPRLQNFREMLEQRGLGRQPLFFAKVDVKACFDTIPQKKLAQLAKTIIDADAYQITKYSRAKLIDSHNKDTPGFGAKPSWRFMTKATVLGHSPHLNKEIETDTAGGRRRTVYVDGGVQKVEHRKAILDLLTQHIEANLIQIGDSFYRQKDGIPQGSIVSSLLCSFFYAELERHELSFIHADGQSLLLRLIDDFLVISPRREIAERFMRTMHAGLPAYGIEAKAEKSRTNFALEIDDVTIPALSPVSAFPYCGHAIDTRTLDLSRDQERRRKANLADSMSIEFSKLPGQTFYRKILTALKLQMRAMLLSTAYNSLATVMANLYQIFVEVALKMFFYVRALPPGRKPRATLVVKTVDDLISLACVLIRRRKRGGKESLPYECAIGGPQARWLAYEAFRSVFGRRQAGFKELLAWVERKMDGLVMKEASRMEVEEVVRKCREEKS